MITTKLRLSSGSALINKKTHTEVEVNQKLDGDAHLLAQHHRANPCSGFSPGTSSGPKGQKQKNHNQGAVQPDHAKSHHHAVVTWCLSLLTHREPETPGLALYFCLAAVRTNHI